jgi:predicted ferric reductase
MLAATNRLTWYVARSSGLMAWAVVTASVLWGLALSSRLIRKRGVPAWLNDLHQFLGTLSLVFTGVHMVALWLDNYVPFGLKQLLIPMTSNWRPGGVAWGIVATYLLVAIQVTSRMMRRMPRKIWHAIHMSSLFMFVAVTVHGFATGADRSNRLVQWLALTGMTLVVTMSLFRLLHSRQARRTNAGPTPTRGSEPVGVR